MSCLEKHPMERQNSILGELKSQITMSGPIIAICIFKNLTTSKTKYLLSHQRNLCFGVPGLLFLPFDVLEGIQ